MGDREDAMRGQPSLALVEDAAGAPHSFAEIVAQLDDRDDLARPALLVAGDEYPGLNVQRYLDRLDDLADDALTSRILGARSECEAARRLALYLAETRGYRGNTDDFYDPRNSFLADVLDRRTGIPLTLSIVLIEVGRRLGLPLVGISFPAHFLVGCGPQRRRQYLLLDPYSGGKVVDHHECELRLRAIGVEPDVAAHLQPATSREVLTRMLQNLRSIYVRRRDTQRALRTIRRLVEVDHCFADEYKKLAATLAGECDFLGARQCLRAFLDAAVDPDAACTARKLLSQLHDLRARRN